MEWEIGNLPIKNQIVIAPMAGITNPAYRQILKEFGAGLIYTEMVSDKGLGHNNRRTWEMLDISEAEKPVSLQLFGSDPESMRAAAIIIDQQTRADIIDINLGCPVPKVTKNGAGSSLMRHPETVYAIVSAVVQAVQKPVTVKIRSGWDQSSINAVEIALLAESAGAKAVAVHARTRSQVYSGKADWEIIKAVKAALRIPVIGNGDITSPESAGTMLKRTGCDAIMIGRGVLGRPWLVRQTLEYLLNGEYDDRVSLDERYRTILRHLMLLKDLKGEKLAILEMRSHGGWYLKGLKNSSEIKGRILETQTILEFTGIIADYFSYLQGLGN